MSEDRKRVLVTGSSRGIGRATALDLAANGFEVTVHCKSNQEAAIETQRQIQSVGGSASVLSFDVGSVEQCRDLLCRDIEQNGPYYGVVLNAGMRSDGPFPALRPEDWHSVINVNLGGFYNVLAPLVMPMIQLHQGGRIVALSSVAGITGNRGQVNYSAAKAGLIGAVKALAQELAKREITVNCVAPGFIESDMTSELPVEEIKKMIPLRRFGKPQEVASLISYLFSENGGYLTAQVLSPNGGII